MKHPDDLSAGKRNERSGTNAGGLAARVRRAGVALGVGAAMVLSLGGCAAAAPDASDDSPTTVTIWSWRTEDKAAMQEIFDEFNAENPDIRVTFDPLDPDSYANKLSTALQGGKGPEIAQLNPYGALQPFVDAGYLEPLDDLVPELGSFSDDAKIAVKGLNDGKLYGVPYAAVNLGVFYNTEIFAEHEIEVPQTYQEFVDACDKLLEAGVVPIAAGGANGQGWALEVALNVLTPGLTGPDFYNDLMSGKKKLTDPSYVAAMQRMSDLLPYFSPGFEGVDYDASTQQFITGQAAMFMGGSYENGSFSSQGGDDLKFSVFTFPADEAGQPAYTSSWVDGSYGLTTDAVNRDAAIKVLNYMATQEFAQKFSDRLGWLPVRDDVAIGDDQPVVQQMLTMQEHSMPNVTLVGYRWDNPTGSSILQPAIIDMIVGKVTPQKLAEDMQQGVEAWFEPNKF